ncbi:MAG: NAD-dependent dehydratase, partial [Chloroflexi bacterium]|nr:NAD-dependent dehydratase [Chloroflexota bacterium]
AATAASVDGEVIQLGTGRSESIGDLFALATRLLGISDVRPVEDAARMRPDRSEVMVLESDPAKARRLLGWTAATSLEDGLTRTIEWLRGRPETGDPRRLQL